MVLDNKLGLTSSAELMLEEERLTKARAVEIFEQRLLDNFPTGTFACLQKIHHHLFQDVYDFAGQVRTVNIAKGNFRFAPAMYLEQALKKIDEMPDNTFGEIVAKYTEMNVAHPFREGNGRSMRIWLDHMLKERIGKVVDWAKIDKTSYLSAMERSPINVLELKTLVFDALTDSINDRAIYMKGIDQSYSYEGYNEYPLNK